MQTKIKNIMQNKLQQIKANRAAYRMGKTVILPHAEKDCKTEADREFLRAAQACGEFYARLDRAYEAGRKSQLHFGCGSFPKNEGVCSRVRKNATRYERG